VKIDLISPLMEDTGNIGKSFRLPQMSLPLLASLTPRDIEVSITDELVDSVDFDEEVDLVGITVNTQTATRAYEIADTYRSRGIPVVLGGIHPKVAQEEAIQHANALVIGEAEGLWPQVLEDHRNGGLKKICFSDFYPSLNNCPIPRRALLIKDRYETVNLVQTSRGCPYRCQFCSVSTMYGDGVRFRSLDNLLREIETLDGDKLFFVDDNIAGLTDYAVEMLHRLIPLKKKWIGQSSVTVANNEKIVRLLRNSGCQGLFVGFESTSIDSLREVGKIQNIHQDYVTCINRLHDNGIPILGSFIVGFDNDDQFCFERLLEFVFKAKIEVIDISTLTPYPGTLLYKRLKREGRLVDDRWWLRYNSNDVVYQPKLMSREQLHDGRIFALSQLYRLYPTARRCAEGWSRRSFFANLITWKANMGYRASTRAIGKRQTLQ
jgi:radical SAM superfamily enzyme YgiQ (UPF0313 family)